MTDMQRGLLEMFKWFHKVCVRNNLRYYALGGTTLGAVRHNGFIPWDDDIDVGMPREDYKKFESVMIGIDDNRYVFENTNSKNEDYFYPYAKLYDTHTTLIENTKAKIKRGIFLDIFPLDGIGNSAEESRNNFKKIARKRALLLTRVTGIRKGRSFIKNAAVVCSRLIPNMVLNNKKLLSDLISECEKMRFEECSWVGNLMGAWGVKELMPRDVLGEPTLYEFEGVLIYGPCQVDKYLTCLYGDWRKLPPIEKQVTHHDFLFCDLTKPYVDEE